MQRFPTFHRNSSITGVRTAREQLLDILSHHYVASAAVAQKGRPGKAGSGGRGSQEGSNRRRWASKMPSSKGKPTDPELREEVKEEVKAEEKGEIDLSVLETRSAVFAPSFHASVLEQLSLPRNGTGTVIMPTTGNTAYNNSASHSTSPLR